MRPLKFTSSNAQAAAEEWGFNCGPAAVAAICGLSIDELRPHLGDFESKRYTNPTLMWAILKRLDRPYSVQWNTPGGEVWPSWGIARVQWEGPWTAPGVPIAASYRHTHWVGVKGSNRSDIGIWDVNCLTNGTGWVSLEEWTSTLVPWLLKECHPRADGRWHLTHSVEVAE